MAPIRAAADHSPPHPYTTVNPRDLKDEIKPVKLAKTKGKKDVYAYDKPFFLSLILKVSAHIFLPTLCLECITSWVYLSCTEQH
jgi:hypothetical protein